MGGLGKFLGKWWGVVVLVVGILAWAGSVIGPGVFAVAAGLALVYFLFRAPMRCLALGRQGRCRNNARGLFGGCHIREHKWQGAKAIFGGRTNGVSRGEVLAADMGQRTASMGTAAAVLGVAVACADLLFK